MLKYDREKVKSILIHEEGYSETMAETFSETLVNLHEDLQPALDQWLEDRTISEEITVESVTLKMIMEKRRDDFMGALGSMSVFIEEPELAKDFLDQPTIIRGPVRKPRDRNEF
ncbi:hypothetical protein GXN76_02110 [Kroppenstedtia pulmonis]|uniref:Uncharacterized protein n=1 Tax=Kroppenstedtia pulmonis TaxID=1380685 RepID=A0A7D3XPE9_9BACL|nr:hypothetical protein [Kroppenstedtia pulmonis]QKG83382.1 hypothetical protein GXN76_02110 [Kroppenstedtia pulmonis]